VKRQSAIFRYFTFPIVRAFGWAALMLAGPFRVRGSRKVPRHGALIVLANHLSDADALGAMVACPRPIRAMADHELFDDSWVGKTLRLLGAFPVVRGASDRNAIRTAIEILQAGDAVGICPEGQMSKDGNLLPLLPGFTLLHRKTGAALICLGLKSTNLIRPYVEPKVTRRAGKWVEANWGSPRDFPKDTPAEEILEWARQELLALTR